MLNRALITLKPAQLMNLRGKREIWKALQLVILLLETFKAALFACAL